MNELVFASQTTSLGRTTLIVARGLGKASSPDRDRSRWPLRDIDLDVPAGAFLGLVGASGSGKSTLLRLLSGLERPTAGRLTVAGVCLNELEESERAAFRASAVSTVFPAQNLLPRLTLLENLELPLLLSRLGRGERRQRAESALELIGLGSRRTCYPSELSPVDRQRVAIARCLVNGASLILADEPHSLLSPRDQTSVLDLLSRLNSVFRKTIVLATRDAAAAALTSQRYQLTKTTARPRVSCCEAGPDEGADAHLVEALSA